MTTITTKEDAALDPRIGITQRIGADPRTMEKMYYAHIGPERRYFASVDVGDVEFQLRVSDRQLAASHRWPSRNRCERCGEPWVGGGRCADCERSYGPVVGDDDEVDA